ncbi:MAG: polyprenyl diphosphate synthase [Brevinemataceae bacterium]
MNENSIQHIAIIPDGNRRWAKQHKLTAIKGHEAGFQSLKRILEDCKDSGPKILSFYAFSTENFKRSTQEVNNLFSLLENVLSNFAKELENNSIQLRISGSKNGIPQKLIKKLDQAVQQCSKGDFILNICFNYGSQDEIVQAVQKIAQQYSDNKITLDNITSDLISSYLYNSDLPPIDLLIRTSGEFRISNFMLWQSAYSEFYFSEKLWPDFTPEDFNNALDVFKQRQRRYGK